MSKERESALRTSRTGAPVQPTPADVQTMAEMHAQRMAPAVTAAPTDAMYQIWASQTKRVIAGRWYIPVGEVTRILTAPTEDPLTEEWQAQCFPNLDIGNTGKPTPEEDSKRWIRVKVDGKNKNKNMKNVNYKE